MWKAILPAVWICLVLPMGCSQEEPALNIDLSRTEDVRISQEEDAVTYAYLPQYSHKVSYQRHRLLIKYLRRETGLNIRQIFPDTFDRHMEMVGKGKIDVSFSNPFIYVKLAQRCGLRAFATVVEINGRKKFRGQIICRADNPFIQSISDCRGKRWIAVDPSSSGGYLYALDHFIAGGLKREDFSEIAFAPGPGGKQEKVVLAVYAGKYDFGTIREGTLDVLRNRIDINRIRVIANTCWYPGWVYGARADLAPGIVAKIKEALFKLDYHQNEHRRILEAANMIGIIPSADQDFDPVRALAERVGVHLKEQP